MAEKEILFLEPVLKENVWGGRRLVEEFGYQAEGSAVGECWGISAHPHGDCVVSRGRFKGQHLSALYREHRELFGNLKSPQFPLLVKIIDAKEKLSIQVHPDDAYAAEHENGSLGKTECWYIMDCPENASLVIGHHAKNREELADLIHSDRYEDLIRHVPVKKGDFIQINPGTVHAITGGFLILETQQSSDITYRVYDYGRLVDGKPRPIHVEQSIQVIRVPDDCEQAVTHAQNLPDNQMNLLEACEYYKVWKLNVSGECILPWEYPFLLLSVLSGERTIDGHAVSKGTHLILPAEYGIIKLQGRMELILSTAVK